MASLGNLTLPQTAGLLVAVAVSCLIAQRAGAYPGAWTWGFLGPIGWILAGMQGIREREARRDRSDNEPRGRVRRRGR